MKDHTLDQYLSTADQPVKDFMAELLEALGKKISDDQDPRLALSYFGAQFEIKLVSFDGSASKTV